MGYRIEYGRGDIHIPPYFGKIPLPTNLFGVLGEFKGIYLCEYYVERFLPLNGLVQKKVREGILRGAR